MFGNISPNWFTAAMGTGIVTPYALMWQWSGGGVTNGIAGFNGDLDSIDAIRLP